MLIWKVFLPLASPGLATIGLGLVAVSQTTLNLAQGAAIVLGLMVVAIAGLFTIRSNVAKTWREQAEGERAQKESAQAELTTCIKEHTEEVAQMKIEWASEVSALKHETLLEAEAKEKAVAERDHALARTDMTPVMSALDELLTLARPS